MNEQIQKLEAQCWEPRQYGPPWFNSTKFAELIVRECAELMYGRDENGNCKDGDVIKKHFGVQE